jgi:hypothetical protein
LVHTYEAQLTAGTPQPLPAEAALDGVEEFLATCCVGSAAWPHKPATVDYHATEGRSWRLTLGGDGTSTTRLAAPGSAAEDDLAPASASVRGTAADLVLALYERIPVDSLKVDGDRRVLDLLIAWDPDE